MKTLDRYLSSGFLKPFLFGLGVFSVFITAGGAVEKAGFFSRYSGGGLLLAKYLAYELPFFISMIFPIAAMIGILFLLSDLMATGQWKAILAGGYRPFDPVKNILKLSLALALVHFLFNETLVPGTYLKSRKVYNVELKKKTLQGQENTENISLKYRDAFFTASSYSPVKKEFERVLAEDYSGSGPFDKIMADKAVWDSAAGHWKFMNLMLVRGKSKERRTEILSEFYSDIIPSPDKIVVGDFSPEGTSFFDLYARIKKLKAIGGPRNPETVALYNKLAGPLACPVMVLIGAAAILGGFVSGRALSLGLAMTFGFLFWSSSVMFQRMSDIQIIPAAAGAFAPHIIFSALALFSMRRKSIF